MCDSTENVCLSSPPPPVPPQVRLPLLQLRSEGGAMVPFDPRGRQRWKECVVQPVNTLTQRGEKKLPTSSFSHCPEAPPVTHGGKEEGGGVEEELGG